MGAMTVSNIVRELNGQAAAFHHRVLHDKYQVVFLGGLWVTLSKPVRVKKVLMVTLGVRPDGRKALLDFQIANSDSGGACGGSCRP
jgi:transposase-like protein